MTAYENNSVPVRQRFVVGKGTVRLQYYLDGKTTNECWKIGLEALAQKHYSEAALVFGSLVELRAKRVLARIGLDIALAGALYKEVIPQFKPRGARSRATKYVHDARERLQDLADKNFADYKKRDVRALVDVMTQLEQRYGTKAK